MITPIDIGSESIFLIGGCRSASVDFSFMGSIFHRCLFDPVTSAPPKNGKPLLLSYLVGGVKDRALLAIRGEWLNRG
ncbi:hypothetical protein, partial [Desulfosarcina sp.]|uniref:hypothetical protein n=1 Tax=Desulfosarcina sp. TaxID=2027861 RepID=UPI0029A7D134